VDKLRRILIRLNNRIIYLLRVKVSPEKILILVPHCLQNSECKAKIVEDVNNCQGCGRCPAADLFETAKKFKVKLFVASGGTLARQTVRRLKIKAIVAVACERELISGIVGSLPLPVIGIINQRPNGPCRETDVEIAKVGKALEFFIEV